MLIKPRRVDWIYLSEREALTDYEILCEFGKEVFVSVIESDPSPDMTQLTRMN